MVGRLGHLFYHDHCLFVGRRSTKHSESENTSIEEEPKSPGAQTRSRHKKRVDTSGAEFEVSIICNVCVPMPTHCTITRFGRKTDRWR